MLTTRYFFFLLLLLFVFYLSHQTAALRRCNPMNFFLGTDSTWPRNTH